MVHHIYGTATPEEKVFGSFTRCKLKQLPIWDLKLASEWKQIDAHQKQNVSLVLPVLNALLEHFNVGALWEKYINKILDDLDIAHTTHERSIYQGTIDGKVILLHRQFFDITVACSAWTLLWCKV